ncbi:MAG TPA: hypothetical protein VHX65_14750, partial [Pirellulales bacterium]|nr:hypothetical protein [Pirellulales bacterium]
NFDRPDPEPCDLLETADELKITLMRGKNGTIFSFELSGGAGALFSDEDGDPGATPEEFAALRKLIERFERRRQLD